MTNNNTKFTSNNTKIIVNKNIIIANKNSQLVRKIIKVSMYLIERNHLSSNKQSVSVVKGSILLKINIEITKLIKTTTIITNQFKLTIKIILIAKLS